MTKQLTFNAPKVSKTIENDFGRFMKFMMNEIHERLINGTLLKLNKKTIDSFEQFSDAKSGSYKSIYVKLSKQTEKRLLRQFTNQRIDFTVKKILNDAAAFNKTQFYSQFERTTGINPSAIALKEGLKPATDALIAETTEWVKEQRDVAISFFNTNALKSMAAGEDFNAILEAGMANAHKFKNDAAFVVRNQMAVFNSTLSNIRAQNLGVEEAEWDAISSVSTKANRVRKSHADRDKKIYNIKKGLWSSVDQKFLKPGIDWNCFEGSVKINSSAFCNILHRRKFDGVCSKITFSDNEAFTTTPNHPILTDKGFKAAYLINDTDNIIRVTNKAIDSIKFNHEEFVPTFDQIFSTFVLNGVVPSVSSQETGNFHGDISNSKVEIIDMNRLLVNEINLSILEKFKQFDFSKADKVFIFKFLTCLGKFEFRNDAFLNPSNSVMSRLNLVMPLFLRHLTPLELFGLTLGSWFDTTINNDNSDSCSTDIESFGDCIFAFTALVHGADVVLKQFEVISSNHSSSLDSSLPAYNRELGNTDSIFIGSNNDSRAVDYFIDRIVDNVDVDFSGHVYNFETVSGYYTASTTVVSNCRCLEKYLVPE